jgi:ribulose-phosphate 3-epimerase
MRAGVALNPHTPVQLLEPILTDIDVVCLMSVNPGFGGQKFIDATYRKVNTLKQMIIAQQASTLIEIDGGVTLDNIGTLIAAGADVLVAGNTVFNSTSPIETIKRLKEAGK